MVMQSSISHGANGCHVGHLREKTVLSLFWKVLCNDAILKVPWGFCPQNLECTLGVVVPVSCGSIQTWNPSTWETETGESVCDTSLEYVGLCHRKTKMNNLNTPVLSTLRRQCSRYVHRGKSLSQCLHVPQPGLLPNSQKWQFFFLLHKTVGAHKGLFSLSSHSLRYSVQPCRPESYF